MGQPLEMANNNYLYVLRSIFLRLASLTHSFLIRLVCPPLFSLTLLCRGEENIYLDDFDVKLQKKLLFTSFKKKISIPAETKNESF